MAEARLTSTDIAAFGARLPARGALIGLDLGSKTIGTAFCDSGWRIATASQTISRGRQAADFAALRRLAGERDIRGIVLGYPLNMDGSAGPRAQATRAFARALEDTFALPLLLYDERLSTATVEAELIAADASRARRAARIDAHAAAHILQCAIDELTAHA